MAQEPTHYEILSLTPSSISSLSTKEETQSLIKRAYRRALLSHHPDKTGTISTTKGQKYTIDQISLAYATLSSPALRENYDKALLLQRQNKAQAPSNFQTGIETTDLDDLDYDEAASEWYRSCRCGNPRGYLFGEDDLEEAADLGELMVGCADCSLWLRVHFAVVDDDEETAGKGP
ncbi:Diphthamide biosynthesis protein 4 [Podospora australis]|uniref:Diphthamide biosynthesis protein 4 n=1 Tax=Podospora australis TaxID=1536484 RepID=A0AAN6X3U2_9PEZI|nr:Diphthamide biosynthesis protein 4 [Podospora australis]